tara:strand:+ start:1211 stop:1816 length:606 start_codon:yes stop_codon:yes gene_type:complete
MKYDGNFFRKYSDILEDISQKSDMQIIVEHVSAIAIDEGEEEIAAVTAALRKLASTGEGRQWAQQQGLDPDNMTDMDIRNKVIVPMGHGAASLAGDAERQIDPKQFQDIMSNLGLVKMAPGVAAGTVPKGQIGLIGAQGIRPSTVDVDVSGGDVSTVMSVLDNLSATFPKARQMFNQGRFKDAMAQIYRRMAQDDPHTPQQ